MEDLIISKLAVQGSLNILIVIMQIIIFGKSISYTIFMNSMKTENDIIENQKTNNSINSLDKEEGFEFVGIDTRNYYFQAINNTNLPKYLFYIRTEDKRKKIFIPENPNIKIEDNYNNNYIIRINVNSTNNQNNNNITKKINENNFNNNYNSSEVERLNKNNEITNRLNNDIINNNDTDLEMDINKNDNNQNEILRLTNENRELKKENDKLLQQIEYVKNQLGLMLNIK